MNKEYEPSGNFGTGNYLLDLGKLSLDNIKPARLDLSEEGAISVAPSNDPADLPSHERPVIPEITEDMSY
jgi:hypothetical protein